MNRPHRFAILILAALISACGGGSGSPQEPPLAGARIGGPFTLTDQNGRTVSQADFAGKYRIMYFGYTFCPDVCPTDMQNIGQAMKLLDRQAPEVVKKLVPVFVSVDPERDTPAVVRQFVNAFDPRIVGLTGSPKAIEAVAKEYAVFYQKQPGAAGQPYLVNHSRTAYLMSPDGKPMMLLPADESGQAVADALKTWVK